ncbi:MAG: hypothetical protein ACXWNK_05835 [Vulcanimicrobiaceae bacterium]
MVHPLHAEAAMLERLALIAFVTATSVPALLSTASPQPSPSPAASVSPQPSASPALKEIGHVRASAACAEIATHANSAITTALRDDLVVAQTITTLRNVDLDDGNVINRQKGLRSLGDLAKMLMLQSRAGDREVQQLRKLAAKSSDQTQKKELKAFADVLGGALWRQQRIARDLNGFLAATDMRDMATLDESQRNANLGTVGVEDPSRAVAPGEVRTGNAIALPQPLWARDASITATDEARAAATDFESRVPDISNDEAMAADHVGGAVSGC